MTNKKDILKFAISWIFYYGGHLMSFPMQWGRIGNAIFFHPYQKMMAWSSDIQGDTNNGPWHNTW